LDPLDRIGKNLSLAVCFLITEVVRLQHDDPRLDILPHGAGPTFIARQPARKVRIAVWVLARGLVQFGKNRFQVRRLVGAVKPVASEFDESIQEI
jgi:hypothetical protein